MSNEPITRGEFTQGMEALRISIDKVGEMLARQDGKIDTLSVQVSERSREAGELTARIDNVEKNQRDAETRCLERDQAIQIRQDRAYSWIMALLGGFMTAILGYFLSKIGGK